MSRKIGDKTSKKSSKWDEAIADAQGMIKRTHDRDRIHRLKLAIEVFRDNRDGGMAWPSSDGSGLPKGNNSTPKRVTH